MDDPNITMKEYIRLKEEKALETEFPTIAFNDEVSFEKILSCEPTVTSLNDEIDFKVSYNDSDDEENTDPKLSDPYAVLTNINTAYPFLNTPYPPSEQKVHGLEYTDVGIADFEERGPLVRELILEFLSTLRFREVLLDVDAPGTIQFQLGGAMRRLSWSQFILALGLHTREEMESPSFARFAAGRKSRAHMSGGQFVARLAEHFRLLIEEILGRLTFIALELLIIVMAELPDAAVGAPGVAQDAPVIDEDDQANLTPVQAPPSLPPPAAAKTIPYRMAKLEEDAWVAMGPERQPDAAVGAPGVAQDAPVIDEDDQANLTPVQEPPPLPPPAAAKTIPYRMAKLEEDVHKMRGID
nr:hypothetical protein [Tanacetum cinerariifolium]